MTRWRPPLDALVACIGDLKTWDEVAAFVGALAENAPDPDKRFLEALQEITSDGPDRVRLAGESLIDLCIMRGLPYPTDPIWLTLSAGLDRQRGNTAARTDPVARGIFTCVAYIVTLATLRAFRGRA